jgi:tRNA A-37 threonylcarbamoyl transferase component Bud32/Tol biopolymer transport system component
MPIAVGEKIGPYQIVAQIGTGGMGVVYKARDPRLGREVAIKVLPSSFSSDPDRLQRFAQEARAAAALNHPSILAIYDIGESGGAPYVVSELLEGETLRQRLRSGALSARKAVEYASEIARGLAAAHDKGIVHRDLKPENLFLTHDGRVKILDFGLAKLTLPESGHSSDDAPTLQIATDPGLVMGTVGYMSPEQVRGKAADHRSDLFALGAILYEMLSGKRAFHGETPADTMSAILKEDPPELSDTARKCPPGLERIVNHCLEKSPGHRFQSASDVAFNLEALTDISSSTRSGFQPVLATPARRRLVPAVLVCAAVLAPVAAYFSGARSRISEPGFHRLTFRRGTILNARFAADGQTIIYGASLEGKPPELFTTRIDSTDSRPFGLERTQPLAVSSKAEAAIILNPSAHGAFLQSGTLAQMPLAGGAPREVLENVQAADWTPDGSELAVIHGGTPGHPNQLDLPLGTVIYQPQGWIGHIRVSPLGDLLAFIDHVPNGDDGRVVVVDRGGNRKAFSPFYQSVQGLAWSRNGKEVWYTAAPGGAARALYAIDLSGKERLVVRVPGTLTLQDINRDGRVLLCLDNVKYGLVGLGAGEREKDLSWFDWSVAGDISSDGKMVLFSETGEAVGTHYSIFARKMDGSAAIRLGEGGFPVFSPDGRFAAAIENSSPSQIELVPIGAGQPRRLTNDSLDHRRVAWLPNGGGLIFTGAESGRPGRTYWTDLNGKTQPVTPEGIFGLIVTADSKYVLAADRQGKYLFYPLEAGGEPKPFSITLDPGDTMVRFTPDGKSLFIAKRGIPAKIMRMFLDNRPPQLIRELMPSDPAGILELRNFQITPDAKTYVYSYYKVLSDLWVVDGLR